VAPTAAFVPAKPGLFVVPAELLSSCTPLPFAGFDAGVTCCERFASDLFRISAFSKSAALSSAARLLEFSHANGSTLLGVVVVENVRGP